MVYKEAGFLSSTPLIIINNKLEDVWNEKVIHYLKLSLFITIKFEKSTFLIWNELFERNRYN